MDEVKFVVAPAQRSHIPTLVQFQQDLAQESEALALDAATLHSGISAVLSNPTKGCYYVVECSSSEEEQEPIAVGCCNITREWSDWRNGYYWYFQSVYVVPKFRRKGVFSLLYRHIFHQAQTEGCKGLRLYVENTNDRAIQAYEAVGMQRSHYLYYEAETAVVAVAAAENP